MYFAPSLSCPRPNQNFTTRPYKMYFIVLLKKKETCKRIILKVSMCISITLYPGVEAEAEVEPSEAKCQQNTKK